VPKVFVHTLEQTGAGWKNEGRDFLRLPIAGEYIALESTGEWYRVTTVLHAPFPSEYDAEVYAVRDDHHEILRKARDQAASPS